MDMDLSLVGKHAKGKKARDVIFEASRRASAAAEEVGADKVVNATIGTMLTDEQTLAYLPVVYETLTQLEPTDFAAYSPFAGSPEYTRAMEDMTFGDHRPDAYISSVATPGSTGAVRNVFWNYLDVGQKILLPDWHWAAYSTVAGEALRQFDLYAMYDENRQFQTASLSAKIDEMLRTQDRALVVINDPGQNPSGYDMSDQDWQGVRDVLVERAKAGKPIILLVDVPYIDYASADDPYFFFEHFSGLPENVLIIVCTSISKSFTLYGLRTGAMIGIGSNKRAVEEFYEVNAYSARGVWTNSPRSGMQVVTRIQNDSTLKARLLKEREGYRALLKERGDLFLKEAEDAGLVTMPYRSGFFISIPHADSATLAKALWDHHIFMVPMKMGIRFAISSVPARKIPGVPKIIQSVISSLS